MMVYHLTISYHILPYLTISYHILPYLTISYHILPYLTISYHILPRVCSSTRWRRQHRFSPECFLNESFSLQMFQLLDEKIHENTTGDFFETAKKRHGMCPRNCKTDPICTTADPYHIAIFSVLGMGTKTTKTP